MQCDGPALSIFANMLRQPGCRLEECSAQTGSVTVAAGGGGGGGPINNFTKI